MKKLRNIIIVLLVFMILALCTISNAAKVEVTKEKLQEVLNNFKNLPTDTNEINENENMEIEVTDDSIKILFGEDEYEIKYDLKDKPTFIVEALINDGMSFEDYEEELSKSLLLMIGYVAVAEIQGVKLEDSGAYFSLWYLAQAFKGVSNSQYIIYNDANTTDNMIPEPSGNQKVIKQSEFDKYVMDYVNTIYENDIILKDSNGINSFEWTMKREDVTDKSCKLVSTMSIDLDADFSKIEKLVDEMENSFNTTVDNSTKENVIVNEVENETNQEKNIVANINSIPKAGTEFGVKNILQILIFVSVLSISIILITNKKENK